MSCSDRRENQRNPWRNEGLSPDRTIEESHIQVDVLSILVFSFRDVEHGQNGHDGDPD